MTDETKEFLEAVGSIDNEKTKNIIMSYTENQIKGYIKRREHAHQINLQCAREGTFDYILSIIEKEQVTRIGYLKERLVEEIIKSTKNGIR